MKNSKFFVLSSGFLRGLVGHFTSQAISIAGLAVMAQTVTGVRAKKLRAEACGGDVRESYAVIGKAARMLGWKPKTSLEEGLRQTWRWLRNERRQPLAS